MLIDLRSDTVTRPCDNMRKAMANAEVGDDVYGDDPSIHALQNKICELTGKEDALFMPSGTQSNLVAILTHCQRGDAFIVPQYAHIYQYEAGGSAVLGGTLPIPLTQDSCGTIPLALIKASIKPQDVHFAPTRLLCLENTFNGKVIDLNYQNQVCQWVKENANLKTHLDGARLFNAAVQTKHSLAQLTQAYDSVSICLSKGLGAPVGSLLCGDKAFIHKAKAWRKMLGGGLRQSGILASAGLYALNHNIERLAEDHEKADILAKLLQEKGFNLEGDGANTNMIFLHEPEAKLVKFNKYMKENGILLSYSGQGEKLRIVLHKDIEDLQMQIVKQAIKAYEA